MSPNDARREARRAFGNVTSIKETARDVWRFDSLLAGVVSDARYALRGLIKKPGFAIAVIFTLALGIGANAVVFALLNAVVLRPLPYPNADRLVALLQRNDIEGESHVLGDVA